MSGVSQEKPFEPTQTRLEKARREGDVARSADLGAAFAFAAALCGTAAALAPLGALARAQLTGRASAGSIALTFAWSLVPALCAASAATSAAFLQSGVRVRPIQVKFERLNPVDGLKRMASQETALAALRASVAVVFILLAAVPAAIRVLAAGIGARTAPALAALVWQDALTAGFALAAVALLFGGADYALALARWKKRLRMSLDELKREQKEQDGDPAAKGKRRSLHRELARSSLQRLKEAAFVVVNPTHIAIALEYAPPAVPVPRVLLRAADETALRMREAAEQLRLPVVENVPLARALYATAQAGDVIPKATYIAVAEIVASLTKAGLLK